jgi:hypothetical protein
MEVYAAMIDYVDGQIPANCMISHPNFQVVQ